MYAMPQRRIVIGFHPERRPFLRLVMVGIERYAEAHGGWRFIPSMLHPGGVDERRVDGLISGVVPSDPKSIRKVLGSPLPKVLVGPDATAFGEHWVGPDHRGIGRRAAAHLVSQGVQTLVLFRHGDPELVEPRWLGKGIAEGGEAAGVTTHVFSNGPRTAKRGTWRLEDQRDDLLDLIKTLAKPVGVLCSDDNHAWRALRFCQEAELRVPQDVAILGVGDDQFICTATRPALSSVRIDQEAIGYETARVMDDLLAGRATDRQTFVAADTLITRRSTGHIATDDPRITDALAFIETHFAEPIGLEEIAHAAHTAPRTLHRVFTAAVGRTPSAAVRQRRIDAASRLIRETTQPLITIALDCGFGQQSAMGRAIKAATGTTPAQMRRAYRA